MEGVLDIMHGRSRRIIDPCIPSMPGRRTSAFLADHADPTCTKLEAPRGVLGYCRTHAMIGRSPVIIFRGFLFEELFIRTKILRLT